MYIDNGNNKGDNDGNIRNRERVIFRREYK